MPLSACPVLCCPCPLPATFGASFFLPRLSNGVLRALFCGWTFSAGPVWSPPGATGAAGRADANVQEAFSMGQRTGHPGFTHRIRQSVLMQILPKIELRSNIQNSPNNNNLNIIQNTCRIYGSVRRCSGSFYFKGD